MLIDAIKQGASDIHFEPYEKNYRVRFRTDGILREVVKPPKNLAPRLSARLKVMSQMDISERRMPQDGRIQMKLSRKPRHRFSGQYPANPVRRKDRAAYPRPHQRTDGHRRAGL